MKSIKEREEERIKFVLIRDGLTAAISFAKQGIEVYGNALKAALEGKNMYGHAYKDELEGSIAYYKVFILNNSRYIKVQL